MDIPQWIKDLPPVAVALISAAIALFSLLVSATSLLISWKNYRRDNYDVKVELQWNALGVHEHGMRSPIKQWFGHITVANKGRRPVNIVFVGLQLPRRSVSSGNWLDQSVTLAEGDPSIIIKVSQDSVLEPFRAEWKQIHATATTNTGRTYKSRHGDDAPIILPGYDLQTAVRLQDFALLMPKAPSKEPRASRQDGAAQKRQKLKSTDAASLPSGP